MKLISALFVLFFMISSPAYAQAEIPAPDSEIENTTSCGVDMGRVIPADGSICREDIAFGMIYEMFPTLFDTLLPFWQLTAFNEISNTPETPDLKGEYYGNDVFFVLFQLFYKLVLYCIGLYLVVIALSVLIRWIRGDSITEKTPMKDNAKSWVLGAGIGGTFLIPIKSFFVGQMIVFTLGIGAISMANFTYSVIMAGNQTLFGEGLEPTRVTQEVTPEGTINRHHYLADHYYKYLSRMHLCRNESTSYQLSGMLTSMNSPGHIDTFTTCAKGVNSPVFAKDWGLASPGPFVWSTVTNNSNPVNGSHVTRDITQIQFESRPRRSLECELGGSGALNYSCGSITINNPDWTESPLIELLDTPNILFQSLEDLSGKINPSMSPDAVFNAVQSSWQEMDATLRESLVQSWRDNKSLEDEGVFVGVNNEVMRKRDALRKALMQDNRPLFMQASRMYHQAAMNILMFGNSSGYRIVQGSDWVDFTENKENFKFHWDKSRELSDIVMDIQCVSNHVGLLESDLMLKFYNGESNRIPQEASARCLNVSENEVREYRKEWDRLSTVELTEKVQERKRELQENLSDKWDSTVEHLAKQRASIEKSFAESMQDEERQSWWTRLRKQGYLSAGDYAQIMNAEVNGYKREVKSLVNNFAADPMFYGDKYISQDIALSFSVDSGYPSYSAGEMSLINTRPEYNRVDPLVGSYHWVSAQESMLRQKSLNLQNFEFSDLLAAWNTGGTYLDRLGIDLYQEGKNEEACLENPEMCPFPLTDPIVELSLMGHDMLDMSIQFYSVAIPMKVLKRMSPTGGHDGAIGGMISKIRSSMGENKVLSGAASLVGGVSSLMGHMVDFIYGTLSGVMGLFMALGAALAYLLPLVPKIYLYLGFVSWLMVLVMASFSIMLLSLFWIRFHEKRDLIRTALLHYGIELAFKPTFNLLAVFFAAYFFYVVAFIVGGTMSFVWDLSSDKDSFLMPYIEIIFILLVVTFVYIIGLRYVYQLMDDLAGEILSRLGVQNKKVKDKVSDFIKAILFDAAQEKTTELHDKAGRLGQKDPREMENRLAQAGKELDEARKARADLRGS
jgi:hypothetical protein